VVSRSGRVGGGGREGGRVGEKRDPSGVGCLIDLVLALDTSHTHSLLLLSLFSHSMSHDIADGGSVAGFLLAWAMASMGKPFPKAVDDRGPLRQVGKEGGKEGGREAATMIFFCFLILCSYINLSFFPILLASRPCVCPTFLSPRLPRPLLDLTTFLTLPPSLPPPLPQLPPAIASAKLSSLPLPPGLCSNGPFGNAIFMGRFILLAMSGKYDFIKARRGGRGEGGREGGRGGMCL